MCPGVGVGPRKAKGMVFLGWEVVSRDGGSKLAMWM